MIGMLGAQFGHPVIADLGEFKGARGVALAERFERRHRER